jgi:hypothetical protein
MMKNYLSSGLVSGLVSGLLGALIVLLSGCATTITSQVTTFQEWSSDPATQSQDKSYRLELTEEQKNDLEFKQYSDILQQHLSALGIKDVSDTNTTPTFLVKMAYATALSGVQVSYPYGPYFYDPIWRLHYSRFYYRSPFFYPYGYGGYGFSRFGDPYFGDGFQGRRYYLHQFAVSITDQKTGKKVFDVRASTEQLDPEILNHIPYLMASAFHNFPGENGKTIKVELPLNKE